MNPIDSNAAAVFHAELLAPLRRAQMRRGSAYLDCGPQPQRESYWKAIVSRTGGIEQLPASQCNFTAALTLLQQYWSRHNERDLLQLASHLERLCCDLTARETPQESASAPPEFVYPLF
jgi:hypothetical protein